MCNIRLYHGIPAIIVAAVFITCQQVSAAPIIRNADDSGAVYLGAVADSDWGRPVSSGDLDGDGFDEVIVGASESFGGITSTVHVMRGGPQATTIGTVDLSSTGADLVISGAAADDNLGSSIATGDVNGDGVDDLLICASNATFSTLTSAGIAYVLYGGANFFDSPTRSMAVTTDWDLRIVGPVAFGDMGGSLAFGGGDTHAAAIGNLNGDAFGDIVLGVHLADGNQNQAGRVYITFGEDFPSGATRFLSTPLFIDVVIQGQGELDEFGDYVVVGDLTGDGIDELIVPNHFFSEVFFSSEGAVHIFRGQAIWPNSINLANVTADITLIGGRSNDELGESAAVGDFNNDGIMDLAAAAPGAEPGAHDTQFGDGIVYGILGTNGFQTGTHTIDFATASPNFQINGEADEHLGAEVAAGDFNGDGFDDIAGVQRFGGPSINGTVDVLLGRSFTPGASFAAGVDTDVRFIGAPSDRIGFSVGAADTDSNGVDEVIFGTPFNNGAFPDTRGTVYVAALANGDFDSDGDRDLADFAAMQRCFDQSVDPNADACFVFDALADGFLDENDLPPFIDQFTGPQ